MAPFAVRARDCALTFEWACDPGVPPCVSADPQRIRQVLVNLIDNAFKFTDRGRVTVSLDALQSSAEEMLLRFVVRDTGIGIPADKQRLIFEPFSQADGSATRRHGGTGLGLAISRRLAGLMGGSISVESWPGTEVRSVSACRQRSPMRRL